MPLLLILAIIFFLVFLKSPQGKGWTGELCVKFVIGRTKPDVRYVINDLKLRVSDDKTSQIDHILINERGVFVIETKNYSGRIYGQENQLEWTQVLNYGRVKNKMYNPLKQNKTHVYYVSNLLKEKTPITPAVVFVQGNTEFINASGVYTLSQFRRLIKSGHRELTVSQMKEIYNTLMSANDSSITRREHIQNIHTVTSNVSNNICPRCGKKLIERNSKNGNFMGCEGFPNCRFTKKL